jgi:acyl-CoA synthetase (AMP-forming)/AMP-acid ligase II
LVERDIRSGLASLVDLLDWRAAERPDAKAFVFVPERGGAHLHLTFAELQRRAHAVARRLARRTVRGDRAVLLFPPGLEFIVAFFGCLAAGVVAVPLMVPRRTAARDSSTAIIADCAPTIAMTTEELFERRPDMSERFRDAGFDWMTVSATDDAAEFADAVLPRTDRNDLAFLQYTSGSTSTPKGVMVANDNLLANLEMIRIAMSNTEHSVSVGWVPLYHDMGLMMGVMQPLYLGAMSVLMAPAAFMQRPLNWLHTIHQYRAELTSAPNFAFDLCVSRFRAEQMEGVDLSCWKLALNGAEPVHADTIERFTETFAPYGFDRGTMYPGYGLAEATLLVAGGERGCGASTRQISRAALQQGEAAEPTDIGDAQKLVSCGHSLAGEHIAIVDPDTTRRTAHCKVGEIWVSGSNITRGYWCNRAATAETFQARVADEPGCDWLRTGDLGFFDENGRLFITGRIKDLIIIRGMNHYPQDIERTVQDSHPALRMDGGAAFAVTDEDGNERLVVVQEVERTQRRNLDLGIVAGCIREAVTRQHEIAIHAIVLIPPATLPKTTSGKVQRSLAKALWLEGALTVLA